MLFNLSGQKYTVPFTATGTDAVLVAGVAGKAIFVHEIIGSNSLAATVSIKNRHTILDTQSLQANQGVTWSNIANLEGEPRFICAPGNDLSMDISVGTFTGGLVYSFRE